MEVASSRYRAFLISKMSYAQANATLRVEQHSRDRAQIFVPTKIAAVSAHYRYPYLHSTRVPGRYAVSHMIVETPVHHPLVSNYLGHLS
jgi:hypothetical protein